MQKYILSLLMILISSALKAEEARPIQPDPEDEDLRVETPAPNVKDFLKDIGNFHKINVINSVNVVYTHSTDTLGHVAYSTTPELAESIFISNNKGDLKIEIDGENVDFSKLPTIYVSSPMVDRVVNNGDFNVRIESDAKVENFTARLAGNGSIVVSNLDAEYVNARIVTGMGTIIISGKCDDADFRMAGTGTIQADMLKATDVTCQYVGGGSISTYPLNNLTAKGIGSTRIHYRGNPKIKHRGGGKLIPNN